MALLVPASASSVRVCFIEEAVLLPGWDAKEAGGSEKPKCCPDCDGKRYRPEILEVSIERKGKRFNVSDVLDLTVSEAAALFAQDRDVIRALQPIVDVGLEYVRLGQPVPTLSGGEAQRLKLAGFLAEAAKSASKSRQSLARKGTLFLFDEPTTGLHFDDIAKLMRALRKLLSIGHSLILIEHDMDLVFRFAKTLSVLVNGAIFVEGTRDEIARDPRVRQVYLGEEEIAHG